MNSIVIVATVNLFELNDLLFYIKIRAWKALLQFFVTFIVAVGFGTDLGLFVGIGISLLLVVEHTAVPHIAVMGKGPDGKFRDVTLIEDAVVIPGTVIIRVEEGLFFANIEQLKMMFKRLEYFGSIHAHPADEKSQTMFQSMVVHVKNVTGLDASALQSLLEIVLEYRERKIFVCFVKLSENYQDMFQKMGLGSNEGEDKYLFQSIQEAIDFIERRNALFVN
jgi:MFS superfamily sulfate permease-like transporter